MQTPTESATQQLVYGQYDYSNLIRVSLPDGIADPSAVFGTEFPETSLIGIAPDDLKDLSGWGFTAHAWWPGAKDPSVNDLAEYQSYDDPITIMSVDMVNKVVYWSRPIRDWSAEEIEADTAPKRVQAIYHSSRDADGFYNAFINQRRLWEQPLFDGAKAFVAAGYLGPVPGVVAAMMGEGYATPQEAADAILAKFDNIDGILGQVFAKREKCQAAIRAAMVSSEVSAAMAEWSAFIDDLCTQLSITRRYSY